MVARLPFSFSWFSLLILLLFRLSSSLSPLPPSLLPLAPPPSGALQVDFACSSASSGGGGGGGTGGSAGGGTGGGGGDYGG
ncbi:unnamed protein product, partial [Closterium sp. NIES-54]